MENGVGQDEQSINNSYKQLMPYIDAQHQRDLVEFKYQGTCASITYKYLWSPFAEFLLKFVPETVAPNLITLVAFVIIVVSHVVFMFEGDSEFTHVIPAWKCLLFGVTLFLYQHLDNMDGKQARKTKNSTAVGMLFDHGCDAISSMLVGIQVIRVMQADDNEISFYAVFLIIMIPNFVLIWTQYGIGAFHLDVINPIDEGLPSYQLLAILGYFLDYSLWRKHHIFASYNYECLLVFLAIAVFVMISTAKNVMKQTRRERKDMLSTLLLPAVAVAIIAGVKLSGLGSLVYGEHFYKYFYTFVFFWGRNEIHMQVCSVAKQKYQVFNWSTLFFTISMALPIIVPSVRPHLSNYLLLCLIVQFLFMMQLIISFLLQAASILKIRLFHVNPPPAEKQQ